MYRYLAYFYSFLIILLALGCNKQTTAPPTGLDADYAYFPLSVGQSWEYQLDSIIFDPGLNGTTIDSSTIYVRETVIDSTAAADGSFNYLIEHAQRQTTSQAWEVKSIFTAQKTNTQALRTEDNLKILKLTFPIRVNSNWNPTLFFDPGLRVDVAGETIEQFKNWEGRVVATTESVEVLGKTYDQVVHTLLADDENLIELRMVQEMYAPSIGLIYREMLILDTQCQVCCSGEFGSCEALEWRNKAEKGFILRQQLIN